MKRKGFTLIELLVVISILSLLITILIPAAGKALDLVKRVSCTASLKGWGSAITQYNTAYEYLPGSWGKGASKSVFHSDLLRELKGASFTKEISFEKMSSYLPGFDPGNTADASEWKIHGAWVCPAVCKQASIVNPQWFWGLQCHTHFAYYARVSEWGNYYRNNTADVDDYVDTSLGGQKLLMSDMILDYTHNGLGWAYNHGKSGPRAVFDNKTSQAAWASTNADITGVNQLYGSGSAEWVPRSRMALDDILKYRTEDHHHGKVQE